ncbi:PRC-barrel domain-containing protein [Polymorphobacter sp. PAMC 29334]|uniref:PRC-barrel domain-containing protein n=1 Tax=Polymorphobacter sp. PAMC 29334 TaxID=2862331 RepID=UPI001C6689A1|nr:PRC-barrel domain-containing protein [Polymorphobacter sp. PAMC 29334]QYE36137.1 PRC-barrel domain-containing protein [Polymorphobacter sp. PAMC 29334]
MSIDRAHVPGCDDAALTPLSLFVGASVAGPDGKAVGTIADVMMAAAEGRIVYVALSVGGIVGIGERLFAVPWGAFVVDPANGALSVRETAGFDGPGFDKDEWPCVADTNFLPHRLVSA